jgi:hypothetical protein
VPRHIKAPRVAIQWWLGSDAVRCTARPARSPPRATRDQLCLVHNTTVRRRAARALDQPGRGGHLPTCMVPLARIERSQTAASCTYLCSIFSCLSLISAGGASIQPGESAMAECGYDPLRALRVLSASAAPLLPEAVTTTARIAYSFRTTGNDGRVCAWHLFAIVFI